MMSPDSIPGSSCFPFKNIPADPQYDHMAAPDFDLSQKMTVLVVF
jgi:hypothetical protein